MLHFYYFILPTGLSSIVNCQLYAGDNNILASGINRVVITLLPNNVLNNVMDWCYGNYATMNRNKIIWYSASSVEYGERSLRLTLPHTPSIRLSYDAFQVLNFTPSSKSQFSLLCSFLCVELDQFFKLTIHIKSPKTQVHNV